MVKGSRHQHQQGDQLDLESTEKSCGDHDQLLYDIGDPATTLGTIQQQLQTLVYLKTGVMVVALLLISLLPLAFQMPRELGGNLELENAPMVMQVLRTLESICCEKLLNYIVDKIYSSMIVGFLVINVATGGLNETTNSKPHLLIQLMVV